MIQSSDTTTSSLQSFSIFRTKVLPVFLPFAGCPHHCLYCQQSTITGAKSTLSVAYCRDQIAEYLSYSSHYTHLAFYGGSFSCIPRRFRGELMALAKSYGFVRIRFSTRPDCITKESLDYMCRYIFDYGVDLVEIGVQSLTHRALVLNERPYDPNGVFESLEKLVVARGILLGLGCSFSLGAGVQIMPGIYGESDTEYYSGLRRLLSVNGDVCGGLVPSDNIISTIRFYPCVVLDGTGLADVYRSGGYEPIHLSRAVRLCVYGYILSLAKGVSVIRMGLPQIGEVLVDAGVDAGVDIIAGFQHSSFGDIVKTVVMCLYINVVGVTRFALLDKGQVLGYRRFNAVSGSELYFGSEEARMSYAVICERLYKSFQGDSFADYIRNFEGSYHRFASEWVEEQQSCTPHYG